MVFINVKGVYKLLELRQLSKKYADNTILLKDVVFEDGKSYLILGASGIGKSTMLSMIGGLIKPSSGAILLSDEDKVIDIAKLSNKELLGLRRGTVGYIVQDFQLFDDFSVEDNIKLKQTIDKNNSKSVESVLKLVGLEGKQKSKVKNLSGGEKQRVAIARSLVGDYKVLLCDEPTGSLNKQIANELMSLLVETHKLQNNILIVVSHDDRMTKYFDEVIYFEDILRGSENV